MLREEMKTS